MISIPFVYIQLWTILYYTWTVPQSLFHFWPLQFSDFFSLFCSGSDTRGWGQPIFQLGGGSRPGPLSHHPSADFRHISSGDRPTYQQHWHKNKAGSVTSYSNSSTTARQIALAAETQRHHLRHFTLPKAIAANHNGCSDISITSYDTDSAARCNWHIQ